MKLKLYILAFFAFSISILNAQNIDHSLWTKILQEHVSDSGNVNYKSIKANKIELDHYLHQLSENSPKDTWSKNELLAYWINAYNAFTIKLILDNYPTNSIKDIKNPWDKKFIKINNKLVSLNYIEHDVLRKMNEPRIHFAIVCASYSCPKLLNKAYESSTLETQLTIAVKSFLTDTSKNKISKNEVQLSKIFKWFDKDFKKNGTLIDFLNNYSDETISMKAKINYKNYNWDLNE